MSFISKCWFSRPRLQLGSEATRDEYKGFSKIIIQVQCLREKNAAVKSSGFLLLSTFCYLVFLIFQVKRPHDFYADELSAFQFKVTVWAISLHFFQLQYVHSACVNVHQQNTKGTKASNLYNGLEWDGRFHLMDEHTKRLKIFTTQKHMVCQHPTPLSSKYTEGKQNPFRYGQCPVNMQLLGKFIHVAYLLYQ